MAEQQQTVSECMDNEDRNNDRFPFSVVWTGLPGITWLLPCIGHLGICDSQGRVWDFDAPYHVGVGHMAFERPRKFFNFIYLYYISFYYLQGMESY